MHKRVLLSWSVTKGYHVDLPTYMMINETHRPVTPGMIDPNGVHDSADSEDVMAIKASVLVQLPDDTPLLDDGQVNARKLRAMYSGNNYYSSRNYNPPLILGDD